MTKTESVPQSATSATAYETSRSSLFRVELIAAIAVAPQIAKPPAIRVEKDSLEPLFIAAYLRPRKTAVTMITTANSPFGPTSMNLSIEI